MGGSLRSPTVRCAEQLIVVKQETKYYFYFRWVLFMLGSNMDPLIYREVMSELSKKIETDASNLRS